MRRAAVLFVALAAAAPCLGGCKQEAQEPPRPVLTYEIVPITVDMFGPFAGTVEARYQTQLGFQVAGRIVSRDVFVGDTVKSGERLAALDPALAQFALARAKADVADADAQYANAQGNADRQIKLTAAGSSTQMALDGAIAARDTAKARLDQAEASLRVAQDQIGYTTLAATFDGVITAWSAEVGQYVNEGQAVVTVARSDTRDAVIDIPDDLIGRVTPGMEFTVRLKVMPQMTARAEAREIGPLADPVTRSHRVRLTLNDPAIVFRIGTTVMVSAERPIDAKIVVPAAAVVEGEHPYVWVLTGNGRKVSRREIAIAAADGDKVVVREGLSAGERVVTVGVHSLKDGEAVTGTDGPFSKPEASQP
jgi:RND family efflux transporter MFP subunit